MRLLEQELWQESGQQPAAGGSVSCEAHDGLRARPKVPELANIPTAQEEAWQLRCTADVHAKMEEFHSNILASMERRLEQHRSACLREVADEVSAQMARAFTAFGSRTSSCDHLAPAYNSDLETTADYDASAQASVGEERMPSSPRAVVQGFRADLARHAARFAAIERNLGLSGEDSPFVRSFMGPVVNAGDVAGTGLARWQGSSVDSQLVDRLKRIEGLVGALLGASARRGGLREPEPADVPSAPGVRGGGCSRGGEEQPKLHVPRLERPGSGARPRPVRAQRPPRRSGGFADHGNSTEKQQLSMESAQETAQEPSPTESPRSRPPRRRVRSARISCAVHRSTPRVPDPALADILARRRSISEGIPLEKACLRQPQAQLRAAAEQKPLRTCQDSLTLSETEMDPALQQGQLLSVSSLSETNTSSDHSQLMMLESSAREDATHQSQQGIAAADDTGQPSLICEPSGASTSSVSMRPPSLLPPEAERQACGGGAEEASGAGCPPPSPACDRSHEQLLHRSSSAEEAQAREPAAEAPCKQRVALAPKREADAEVAGGQPVACIVSPPTVKRLVRAAASPVRMTSCTLPGHQSLLSVMGHGGTLSPLRPVDARMNLAMPVRQCWGSALPARATQPLGKRGVARPQADTVGSPPEPQTRSPTSYGLLGSSLRTGKQLPAGGAGALLSPGGTRQWPTVPPARRPSRSPPPGQLAAAERQGTPQRCLPSPTGSPVPSPPRGGLLQTPRMLPTCSQPAVQPPPLSATLGAPPPQSLSASTSAAATAAGGRPCVA
mmetsp:Transcript_123284/g.343276  ORF Transcript_123284/g.343276 Transcript_123284/m.343276 type:complete len:787 (+) Transcript_123284:90-2450(+)